MMKKTVEVRLPGGLESRPVAELVQLASKYESFVHIEVDQKRVNAKSIMGMMTLSLSQGREIVIEAEGADEEAAIQDMERFLLDRSGKE